MDPGASSRPSSSERNPFRCYDGRFLLEVVLVSVALIGIALVVRHFPRGSPARFVGAALESLGFAWMFTRTVLALRSLDELQRHIHLIAIAIAFTLTGVLVVSLGFFEKAGMPRLSWGLWLFPSMIIVWWISVVVLDRRYR